MKLRNLISLLAVLILSIASGSSSLYAQGTDLGTIRGTVTDSGGALLPNAQVEITDLSTLTTHHATTNQHGEYEVPALPGGRYKATITAAGFRTATVNGILLSGSDAASATAATSTPSSTSIPTSRRATSPATSNSSARKVTAPAFPWTDSAPTAASSDRPRRASHRSKRLPT